MSESWRTTFCFFFRTTFDLLGEVVSSWGERTKERLEGCNWRVQLAGSKQTISVVGMDLSMLRTCDWWSLSLLDSLRVRFFFTFLVSFLFNLLLLLHCSMSSIKEKSSLNLAEKGRDGTNEAVSYELVEVRRFGLHRQFTQAILTSPSERRCTMIERWSVRSGLSRC